MTINYYCQFHHQRVLITTSELYGVLSFFTDVLYSFKNNYAQSNGYCIPQSSQMFFPFLNSIKVIKIKRDKERKSTIEISYFTRARDVDFIFPSE